MQLGKHVYVQKPLTRTVSEARALTEAARKYKVVTQMGNQGHSEEGLRLMQEWLAAGAIGPVREVHCWTNRPVWPQGMPRPTDTPAVPDGLDWDLWIGPAPMRPVQPHLSPVRLARVAGLRRRRDGRHGLPRDGRGLHDSEARRADQRDCVGSLQRPAPRPRPAWFRQPRGLQRQLSAVGGHPPVVPGARRHAAGEAALVRRRHPARAAGRSRAGAEAAGVGHDLHRRQGQDVVRDLLGEPAAHPRDGDDRLRAPAEDAAAGPGGARRTREELARRHSAEGPGGVELRLRRPVHRVGAARQRGAALPGHAAHVGWADHEDHQPARGRPVPSASPTARAGRCRGLRDRLQATGCRLQACRPEGLEPDRPAVCSLQPGA